MSANHHAEQSASRLRNGTDREVARAQVEATLASAFEQRTSNLIAFYATIPRNATDEATAGLRGQIIERLGLA